MGVGTFDKITEICYEYAILVLSGDGAFRTPLLSAPHSPRFFLGRRFLGRRFLGRCFLGRRFLDRRSSFSRSSFSRHPNLHVAFLCLKERPK